jgi:hypothetical protein
MQGESAAIARYNSSNSAIRNNEEQMAEATIGALSNLATATAADRGVVAALTQADASLVKMLEENQTSFKNTKP